VRTLKPILVACAALLIAAPAALAQPAAAPGGGGAALAALHTQPVRFGGFGRPSFGRSRGFGRGRYGYRSRRRGPGIFRRIVRALAIGYLLHLLFTTPGGLIVLLFMIAGFALLISRFRRRRILRY
jgi:hypothetical protein